MKDFFYWCWRLFITYGIIILFVIVLHYSIVKDLPNAPPYVDPVKTLQAQVTNLERINHTLAYKLREVISDVNYRHNLDRGQLTSSYQLNSTRELDKWCSECHYGGER